ncbi:MAG: hypothetical protein AAF999_10305 [Pseudomonadota bacterium]
MLKLDHKVPDALVLPEPVVDLKAHLASKGAHWFCALPEYTDQTDTGAVRSLKSVTDDKVATRTRANKDNSRLTEGGLSFHEAMQCGFLMEGATINPGRWSVAVRFYASQNAARTLVTLNPADSENYVFLQQMSGRMVFKDRQTTLEVTVASEASTGPTLVLAGMSEGRLWLCGEEGEVQRSKQGALGLEGLMTLFVGCRNDKGRLHKTLGAFTLFDLVFWPDLNVLEPGARETTDALTDHHLWRPAR